MPALTDERLFAVQKRIALELVAGGNEQVIVESRGLTGRYPLREPFWELVLRALSADGRPAEAIHGYHRAREILASELGVAPSPELTELHRQLLQAGRAESAVRSTSAFRELQADVPDDLPLDEPPARVAGHEEPDLGHRSWVPSVPRQLPAGMAGFAGRGCC